MEQSWRTDLVDTTTIYNKFRDPLTGNEVFYRTFLEYTLRTTQRSNVAVSATGTTRRNDDVILMDSGQRGDATFAYGKNDDGSRLDKEYVSPREWRAAEDKSGIWTVQEQDYVLDGVCSVSIPPDKKSDLTALDARVVREVAVVRDGGRITLLKVYLV